MKEIPNLFWCLVGLLFTYMAAFVFGCFPFQEARVPISKDYYFTEKITVESMGESKTIILHRRGLRS